MPNNCSLYNRGSDVIAQQLFLGSSIISFNNNLGWGGSSSSLNIELINDYACSLNNDQIIVNSDKFNTNNHYYDCVGSDCYMDENGNPYDVTTSKNKLVPGKVHHVIGTNGIYSKYWRKSDPGFFGDRTSIGPDGNYDPLSSYVYNIIGVPVYFRYGYFTFGGIVTNWEKQNRLGTITYSVNISSIDQILDGCKVILDKYTGAIYGTTGGGIGGPINYTGAGVSYTGPLKHGNIPNVFNVYGYLESFGFGTSDKNEDGIPISTALDALSVLTSSNSGLGTKAAFSPFGRIICQAPLTDSVSPTQTSFQNTENGFGIIPSYTDNYGATRTSFLLDLSDIPRPPLEIRIGAGDGIVSISDLIRIACDRTGHDFYTSIIRKNGQNFIKIKTINRTTSVGSNNINRLITNLENSGIPVTSSSSGKEYNKCSPRVMYIGGNQQRLLQVKDYTLAYSQSVMVYNPVIDKFVFYKRFGNKSSSIKNPNLLSTKSGFSAGQFTPSDIVSETIRSSLTQNNFFQNDSNFSDTQVGGSSTPIVGNYDSAITYGNKIDYPKKPTTKKREKSEYAELCTLFVEPGYREEDYDTSKWVNKKAKNKYCPLKNPAQMPSDLITIELPDLAETLFPDTETIVFDSGPTDADLAGTDGPITEENPTPPADEPPADEPPADEPATTDTTTPDEPEYPTDTPPTPVEVAEEIAGYGDIINKQPSPKDGDGTKSEAQQNRYIPLHNHAISPFFGYKFNEKFSLSNTSDNNTYRYVRPVFIDSFTGQLVVGMNIYELPVLSLGSMASLYGKPTDDLGFGGKIKADGGLSNDTPITTSQTQTTTNVDPETGEKTPEGNDPATVANAVEALKQFGFKITESEMRAATVGWESYMTYCLAKHTLEKPDLFVMLVALYKKLGKFYGPPGSKTVNSQQTNSTEGLAGQESISYANQVDEKQTDRPVVDHNKLNINFNFNINHEFIKDFMILSDFVKTISTNYYGKKYMVRAPEMVAYQDKQSGFSIPSSSGPVNVYKGSGKLFFNYEIADGAWEEPGNYIDDTVVVGGPVWYKLIDDKGLIKPILGYNANYNFDDVSRLWCEQSDEFRAKELGITVEEVQASGLAKARSEGNAMASKLGFTIDCDKKIVPSIDFSNLDDYIIVPTYDTRVDAYGRSSPPESKIPPVRYPCVEDLGKKNPDIYESDTSVTYCEPDQPCPIRKKQIKCEDCVTATGEAEELGLIVCTDTMVDIDSSDKCCPTITAGAGQECPANSSVSTITDPEPCDRQQEVIYGQKLYLNASCEEVAFLDPDNLLGPRVIINNSNPIKLFISSYSYASDPNLTVISNVAVEDISALKFRNMLTEDLLKSYAAAYVPVLSNLFIAHEGETSNQSSKHAMIAPKMAQPLFAGVPLKSNIYTYGPWTNYPYNYNQTVVFPELNNTSDSIEQLIADTKVEQRDDFVPWNYGGMNYLDTVVNNTIESENSFQTVLENGQLSIAGPPIFGLCGNYITGVTDSDVYGINLRNFYGYSYETISSKISNSYYGLVLSNLSLNVSANNVTTNYSFRTYSPKLGLYNKENSDRIKQFTLSRINLAKKISDSQSQFQREIISQVSDILKGQMTDRKSSGLSNFESKIYGTSPGNVFVGKASHFIPKTEIINADPGYKEPKNTTDTTAETGAGTDAETGAGTDAETGTAASFTNTTSNNITHRHNTYVGLFMDSEIYSELAKEYKSKSAMSLDGIMSPISFYPTEKNATYALSSRCVTKTLKDKKVTCPSCKGSGKIKDMVLGKDDKNTEQEFPCPLCSKAKLQESVPKPSEDDELAIINSISLNPVVVPYGEFRNPNAQKETEAPTERCRHSISVVGRFEDMPSEYQGVDINKNLSSLYNPENGKFTYTREETKDRTIEGFFKLGFDAESSEKSDLKTSVNKDYFEYDLSYKLRKHSIDANNSNILLNQRFFGLRGPLMMHGWGYDTDGYPIPNAADEPKEFDDVGRPKRFLLTADGANDLTKDGAFLPPESGLLGDIIGKGYSLEGDQWVKTPSKYFHLNWAERPDLWPVGPIDLRWDNERKVWTGGGGGGCEEQYPPYIITNLSETKVLNKFISKTKNTKKCPYKMVYIVLEEDMVKNTGSSETYPARAFIDDLEYSLTPLPVNSRRLIYVKDRCGFTAPRGAKLLCRYDVDTGFYEPITRQTFVVFGTLSEGNNAVVDLTYVQGIKAGESFPRISITFDNTRFNFNISNKNDKRGMFLFENGKWVLIGHN